MQDRLRCISFGKKRGERKVKVRQILVMDDKEIDLEQLSKEEQKQMEARLNAAALRQAGYEPSPRRKDP